MADFYGDKGCGPTHHMGCECYEAKRNAELEQLRAENEKLRAGPPGPDRRWKVACEEVMGCTFNTPREMIYRLLQLRAERDEYRAALEDIRDHDMRDRGNGVLSMCMGAKHARAALGKYGKGKV